MGAVKLSDFFLQNSIFLLFNTNKILLFLNDVIYFSYIQPDSLTVPIIYLSIAYKMVIKSVPQKHCRYMIPKSVSQSCNTQCFPLLPKSCFCPGLAITSVF